MLTHESRQLRMWLIFDVSRIRVIATFYIYVEGSDLVEVATELRSRIEEFVEPYGGRVRVVDQREEKDEFSADLPDWDLGVNFEFEALTDSEKKDVVLFFHSLSAEFARDFVLGGVLPSGQTEDLVCIGADEPLEGALDILYANET